MQFILRYTILLLLLIPLWSGSGMLYAQVIEEEQEEKDDGVDILFQKKLRTVMKEGREINYFYGDVVFRQDDVLIYCDSGLMDDKIVKAWGNVIIKQGDTLNIFSDRLNYNGETKKAVFEQNVVLQNRDQKLFTRKLFYDVETRVATYFNSATLTDDKTYLRSKKGTYFTKSDYAIFKDSVVVVDPEFKLKTDTIHFNTATKVAFFKAPTLITFENSRIYTEDGYYDINNKDALFNKNPQYLSENQRSRAEVIKYDGENRIIRLLEKAVYQEEDRMARGDSIIFYEEQDLVDIQGRGMISEVTQFALGNRLIYDRAQKAFKSPERVLIIDPPNLLEADSVDFTDADGFGIAVGQVIWEDKSQNITIFCEEILYNKEEDYVKAWGGRPLLMINMDESDLFVAGDTMVNFRKIIDPEAEEETPFELVIDTIFMDSLISHLDTLMLTSIDSMPPLEDFIEDIEIHGDELSEEFAPRDTVPSEEQLKELYKPGPIVESDTAFVGFDPDQPLTDMEEDSLFIGPILPDSLELLPLQPDTIKVLQVYHNVEIIKDEISAISDSLTFNTLDSVFTFYRDPIMWSDSTQFFGDTITMLMKEKKLHRMDLLQNALILSTPNEVFFDQIRGKLINAFFIDGSLDNVLVTGNAETVYYVLDEEDQYTGVNSKQASKMRIFFEEKEMVNIRFYDTPDGKFIPISKANHEELKLSGFKWLADKQPTDIREMTLLDWLPWDIILPASYGIIDETPPEDLEVLEFLPIEPASRL